MSVYRLVSPAGQAAENGEADVSVTGGALVVAPSPAAGPAGAVLRVPFGQIASVSEPEPFVVRVAFTDGGAVELSRLGVMRTQLLAEIRDGMDSVTGAVGAADTFQAWCGEAAARVRVYDDCFMVDDARIGFSFVTDVVVKDYAVTVSVAGREPLALTRLGRQSTELAGLLNQRLGEARVRTASFFGSLLPGLGPSQARSVAAALRDGVAVPTRDLDLVHPELSGTLLRVATLPDRSAAVTWLAERTEIAIGFKQVATVRRPAIGVEPWHDHAAPPHIGSHESPAGLFQPGAAGMLAAGLMSDLGAGGLGPGGGPGPVGLGYTDRLGPGGGLGPGFGFTDGLGAFGEYWAFRALGAGMNSAGMNSAGMNSAGMNGRQQRPMASRPDVTRGLLTPSADDPSALTVSGAEPTVLAFVLCAARGRVIYEVLNQAEPDTYVFAADEDGGLSTLNRALDETGFAPESGTGPLARSPSDRIPHDDHWRERIMSLLSA